MGSQSRLWEHIGEILHPDQDGDKGLPGGGGTKPELEWVKDGKGLARQRSLSSGERKRTEAEKGACPLILLIPSMPR